MLDFSVASAYGLVSLTLSLIGSYVISIRRGAERLDTELHDEISKKQASIREAQTRNEELKSLLAKPKRTAIEEREYQGVKTILEKYGEPEKDLLRYIRMHGKIKETYIMGFSSLPPNLKPEEAKSLLGKLVIHNLVSMEQTQALRGFENTWQLAPGAVPALTELL